MDGTGTTDKALAGFVLLAEMIAASAETVEEFAARVTERINATNV